MISHCEGSIELIHSESIRESFFEVRYFAYIQYTLSTIDENGEKDFDTHSKNGDRNKILATIVTTVFIFSENNPDKMIFLQGNRASKTKLYRMAIKGNDYEAFLFRRIIKIEEKD